MVLVQPGEPVGALESMLINSAKDIRGNFPPADQHGSCMLLNDPKEHPRTRYHKEGPGGLFLASVLRNRSLVSAVIFAADTPSGWIGDPMISNTVPTTLAPVPPRLSAHHLHPRNSALALFAAHDETWVAMCTLARTLEASNLASHPDMTLRNLADLAPKIRRAQALRSRFLRCVGLRYREAAAGYAALCADCVNDDPLMQHFFATYTAPQNIRTLAIIH